MIWCCDTCPGAQTIEEMLKDIDRNRPDSPVPEPATKDKVSPAPAVKRHGRKRLVHGDDGMSETTQSQPVTNCLLYGITEHNPDIFNGMMAVDPEITLRSAGEIETPVFCHRRQHMVKERHTTVNRYLPAPSGFSLIAIVVSFVSRFTVTFLIDFPPELL